MRLSSTIGSSNMKPVSSVPLLVTIALLIAFSWTLVGISTPPAAAQGVQFWNKPCKKALKQWQNAQKHKALATSNPNTSSGGQACGSACAMLRSQRQRRPQSPFAEKQITGCAGSSGRSDVFRASVAVSINRPLHPLRVFGVIGLAIEIAGGEAFHHFADCGEAGFVDMRFSVP